ncbi:MAG: histidine kinase, partial [Calditrichaeota bacterium]
MPVSPQEAEKLASYLDREYYSEVLGAKGGEVSYVYTDRTDTLWCVIYKEGLYQFDRRCRQFVPYDIDRDQSVSKEICLIYQDRSGVIWFGTVGKGLVKRVPADGHGAEETFHFIRYQRNDDVPNSISSNTIHSILEDREGNFWIATDLGLNRWDAGTDSFIHFRMSDGLPSDLIYGILEDDQGNLWLSTNHGLSKFNPNTRTFKNYFDEVQIQGNVYGINALCRRRNGEMFFGGENGLNAFHPDSIRENSHIPSIVITDFLLFNKSVTPGGKSPLKKTITETSEILLAHDQDVFSFEFAALDFTHPEQNKYAYKMEGVDPDWVYTDASRRFATYTRLSP